MVAAEQTATTDNSAAPPAATSTESTAPDTAPTSGSDAVAKAFARAADSSSATPATAVAPVSGAKPAATTIASPAAAATATTEAKPIAPPEDRWPTILENARRESSEKTAAEFAWAKGLNPKDVQDGIRLLSLINDEKGAKNLLALLQKELAPAADLSDPEPDLVSSDGRKAFSDVAVLKIIKNAETRIMNAVMRDMKPTMEFARSEQDRAMQASIKAEAAQSADVIFADIKALPWYQQDTHGPLIAAELKAVPVEWRQKHGSVAALFRATQAVYAKHVWPTLQRDAEASVEADNKRKAAASIGVVPAGAATGATVRKNRTTAEVVRDAYTAAGRPQG